MFLEFYLTTGFFYFFICRFMDRQIHIFRKAIVSLSNLISRKQFLHQEYKRRDFKI